jgi:hypothetical protein
MPPRHNYWTIIFGNQPTSFRAATREELLPTFRQIQARHPDAVMMWFASGRLWRSEEEFREARFKRRERERRPPPFARPASKPSFREGPPKRHEGGERKERGERPQERRPKDRWRDRPGPPASGQVKRGRDWRPGGQHKDPRDRFKVPRDVKRARFKARARRDRVSPRPPKKKDEE